MEWISQNWVWVLFAVAMVAMHLFGHGGHDDRQKDTTLARKDSGTDSSEPRSGHHH